MCIEREKKIFAFNSTECRCEALQLLLLFVLAGKKKMYLCILMIHVCIERKKKSLQLSTQLNAVVWHCSCCCCYLCWLVKKMYLCILMIHVCIESEKKILSSFQLTPAVRHCSCCCYYVGWKKKNFICVF